MFFSCASTRKDAITEQEDFIKNHPNWKGHDFWFKQRKPDTDIFEVVEAINQEKKNKSLRDSILIIDEKEKWYQAPPSWGFLFIASHTL